MLGGIIYYASLDNPKLEQAKIDLINVKVLDVNKLEKYSKLQITFLVKNPTEKTFTVPVIIYELFANEKSIGSGQYSTEDISMPGRAAFYPKTEIPLTNTFRLVFSDRISHEYEDIINNRDVVFRAEGMITLETAWSIIEKEFQVSL